MCITLLQGTLAKMHHSAYCDPMHIRTTRCAIRIKSSHSFPCLSVTYLMPLDIYMTAAGSKLCYRYHSSGLFRAENRRVQFMSNYCNSTQFAQNCSKLMGAISLSQKSMGAFAPITPL